MVDVTRGGQTEIESSTLCTCGRALRKLNAASDVPRCDGCGYVAELCRCERLTD